jgi:hypothetical protein
VTAFVLVTDHYFTHYAVIIHPDATQFTLALLTLAVAARHVKTGDLESLTALGLLSGLVPMVAIAGLVGLRHRPDLQRWGARFTELSRRGLLLVAVSLGAYFVSTPYAFLSPDFLRMTKVIVGPVGSSALTPTTALTWLTDLWTHFAPGMLLPAAAGALGICLQAALGRPRWPMLLALVLRLTQLAWYSINSKLWVDSVTCWGPFSTLASSPGSFCGISLAPSPASARSGESAPRRQRATGQRAARRPRREPADAPLPLGRRSGPHRLSSTGYALGPAQGRGRVRCRKPAARSSPGSKESRPPAGNGRGTP